jgi:hypothetical protein
VKDTKKVLEILSFMFDVIMTKVLRLGLSLQKQRACLRRETAEAAIIASLLMLAGLASFTVVLRFL